MKDLASQKGRGIVANKYNSDLARTKSNMRRTAHRRDQQHMRHEIEEATKNLRQQRANIDEQLKENTQRIKQVNAGGKLTKKTRRVNTTTAATQPMHSAQSIYDQYRVPLEDLQRAFPNPPAPGHVHFNPNASTSGAHHSASLDDLPFPIVADFTNHHSSTQNVETMTSEDIYDLRFYSQI